MHFPATALIFFYFDIFAHAKAKKKRKEQKNLIQENKK